MAGNCADVLDILGYGGITLGVEGYLEMWRDILRCGGIFCRCGEVFC